MSFNIQISILQKRKDLILLVKSGRDLTSTSLHLLFRNGSDLMSIYKHKVSLAPKNFLLLPPFDLPIFRLMIRFALCSRVFHSHGWWTFPTYVGLSCHLFPGPLFWECPPPTLGLYPMLSIRVFFFGEFSQKFDLKNVISTNTWDKWSKSAKF